MLKTNTVKRVSAFLLALIMLIGALPLNVFAEGLQGKTANPIVIDSDTINKDGSSGESKDPTTGPTKHTISFNPNGGTGDMESVEAAEGEEYSLPKNKFKAPEGKEFKNWLMDKEELKEGHKLVVTKDIELKANWKDIKVNPVKKALNSLIGKEDKEELDVSKELVGEAVTNDGEYTGPAHNSVVSSDGKVQIRNFEVFWTSTDSDTIVDTRDWENRYSPNNAKMLSNFDYEPKMQINWALSGEVQYPKGAMTITIPDMKFEDENDLKYPLKGYSVPELKFKEDGSIDFDANYGNATLAYYYDQENKAIKITNILDLSPGASGTFTLTYSKFAGNSRWLKDMTIFEIKPVIDLKYNDEVLETQDKSLKIQQDTKLDATVWKDGELFKTWQDEWGAEFKPENAEDYWYVCYKITVTVKDYLQTNYDIRLTDSLGPIKEYNSKHQENNELIKTVEGEQEIVAYSDPSDKYYNFNAVNFTNKPLSKDTIEWSEKNINISEDETKKDDYSNPNVYENGDLSWVYDLTKGYKRRSYVLTKIPAKKLGYMDKKKNHSIKVENNVQLEVTQKNSNNEKIKKTDLGYAKDIYTYVPDVEFTAPPGDTFSLTKSVKSTSYGGFDSYYTDKNTGDKGTYQLFPFNRQIDKDIYVQWKIVGSSKIANATYDEKYKDDENPSNAYGKKKVRHELVDDYLYLADDYSKELTSEDYSVDNVQVKGFGIFNYGQPDKKSEAKYYPVPDKDSGNIPISLCLRKDSTGDWEKVASFNLDKFCRIVDFKALKEGVKYNYQTISVPKGYTSAKLECETSYAGLYFDMRVNGYLHMSERVKNYIESSKDDNYTMNIRLRNDSTYAVYDEKDNILGVQGTTESNSNIDRTLELDRKNYGVEMYHSPAHIYLRQDHVPEVYRRQGLSKYISSFENSSKNKCFKIPVSVDYWEEAHNYKENNKEANKVLHKQESGTFYDLLPLGVTGVEGVNIVSHSYKNKNSDYTSKNLLSSSYKLIPNWKNSGRTMLITSFNNAELIKIIEGKLNSDISYCAATLSLEYNMIYPWDSYKDYGSKMDKNLVAYESGFKKKDGDGLDADLTNELENGLNDLPCSQITYLRQDGGGSPRVFKNNFTDQEIEWMKDLNPNHDEKRFLYSEDSTTVSGDTEANVGLTKHVSTDINPNFTLKSTTKEGGNYQYKIRLQAAHGTSVSNLVFFDSIENYDPLKADEDYGIKQWRGTLSSIDLNHPIMKGIAPKVYVSTKPKLDIEKHNDVSDSTIWKLYKEGDDLSNVQAVAIDLRKNKDGSDFKLEQDTAINVYLNMKAPWNLKEKQIDPKAKALNAIYASNTVTTSLDNKSTKLIYTAYTAVNLKPVTTEAQIKATKRHLDKEGKDIALKGNDFKFELRDSNNKVLQTKTNDNKGNITFDPIKYNSWDVGEHTYKIVEVKGDSETTAYDNHEEIVKVKVERSGDSELKATTTYDKDGAAFNNHEVDAITASLEAKKVYIGKGGLEEKPKAGAFEFILKDAEGKEVAKATNDAEGNVVFEGLEFKSNQIGEHKYTIEEVKGKDPTIEYDNTKKNVTVNISLTKDFKLKADVVYDKGETPTFTNTLKSASLQLVKLKDGSDPFILDEVKDKNGFLTSYKVPEAQKDNVLDGAEYELYKLTEGKEELIATLITKNGISQVVQDIMPGKYKLKETKAPKGYTLNDKDLIFEITDKDAGTIVAKFATDDSIIDMPSTGGQGTKALMIGGGILVAIMAGALVVANKKKKEELNK